MTSASYAPPLEWKSAKWWANRSIEERIAWANFPERFTDITLDNAEISDKKRTAAKDYIESLLQKDSRGLLITGKAGSGKTVVAQAIGKEIIKQQKKAVHFVASDRYVEMIKDSFDADNNELPEMYDMPHLLRYLTDVFHVVILDALGRERPTEFAQYELGALLRRRWEACRPTVVTTSLSMTDITHRYGDSARAVMVNMHHINMSGAS